MAALVTHHSFVDAPGRREYTPDYLLPPWQCCRSLTLEVRSRYLTGRQTRLDTLLLSKYHTHSDRQLLEMENQRMDHNTGTANGRQRPWQTPHNWNVVDFPALSLILPAV